MKYLLFLGCVIPYRVLSYEISARKILAEFGVELIDMPNFNCCGFPLEAINYEATLVLAARNLCIAEEEGLSILALCNGCSETLYLVNKKLKESKELREKVNDFLSNIGMEFKGKIEVKHLARVLYEDIGVERIKKKVVNPLSELVVAQHGGCHLFRPVKHIQFDDPDNPVKFKSLIEATGAKCVSYPDESQCCGGPISGIESKLALQLVADKLKRIKGVGAQALITVCPYCHLMYDSMQKMAEREAGEEFGIPVLHYPQLLGLAMGMDPKELAIDMLRVKATKILELV